MSARIQSISYHLPAGELTNDDLAEQFPEWSVQKIAAKTGIHTRHIAADDEFASDLAEAAARRLFEDHSVDPASIDYLIVCTQSAEYFMPSTALLLHGRLGLRLDSGATDITLGCSGYVYSLGLAKGLIETGQASRVLVITTDTYSKFVNPGDKSVRTLFGDGATATLVTDGGTAESLTAFVYGSDGSAGRHLVVPGGGLHPTGDFPKADPAARGLVSNGYDLYMDGPEIFNFTLRVVPAAVDSALSKAGIGKDDIDLFVFHQANSYMLETLRKKLDIPEERFVVSMAQSGNTVSSTIPIALAGQVEAGALKPGMRVLLLGFGVGLSWGATIVEW
jgi:3-oxoacyl-[acyl-carrier-protein] synthase-3